MDAFEEEVVPIEDDVSVDVFRGMGTEVDVADAPAEAGMAANFNQQMLLGARCLGAIRGLWRPCNCGECLR